MTESPDKKNYDYTMVDDEFTDDVKISTAARAAYVSIKRHARITGYTDKPAYILMRGCGIKKRAAWKRVSKELASLGYIKIHETTQTRPPRLYLVGVKKNRARPKKASHMWPGVSPSGSNLDPKSVQHGPKSGPTDTSTPRAGEGERKRLSPARSESGPEPEGAPSSLRPPTSMDREYYRRNGSWPPGVEPENRVEK